MGSQSIRKKGTKNSQNTTSDIKRQIDQDAARTALEPSFELGHSPAGVMVPEFIRVSDKIDRSSQTVTAPFNTTTLNLWLKFNGNYIDYSNETNDVYAHVFQRNKAFMTGKFGAYAANLNWPSLPVDTQSDCIIIPAGTPTALDFTNGWSVCMWIYPRVAPTGNPRRLYAKRLDSSNHFQLSLDTSRILQAQVTEAAAAVRRTHTTPVVLNTWSSVVCTYSGSAVELYLNKSAGSAGSLDQGAPSAGFTNTQIGNLLGGTGYGFQGGIDEVMYVKAQALNQTQVNSYHDNNSF